MPIGPRLKQILARLNPQHVVGASGLTVFSAASFLSFVPTEPGTFTAALAAYLSGMGLSILAGVLQQKYTNLLDEPSDDELKRLTQVAQALQRDIEQQPELQTEVEQFLQKEDAFRIAEAVARDNDTVQGLLLLGIYQKVAQQGDILLLIQQGQGRIETRLKEVATNLDRLRDTIQIGTLSAPDPRPIPFRVPHARNPLFVGRTSDLERLEILLADEQAVVVLCGVGGLGKTQLAVEYAYRAQEAGRYPSGVFWLVMDDPTGVATQVANFAGPRGLNLPGWHPTNFEQNLDNVLAAWDGPEARLLVFDNCEDSALLALWRRNVGGSRMLVTSRNAQWTARLGVRVFRLGLLPRSASMDLLLRPRAQVRERLVGDLLADEATAGDADALCDTLGDLPLALALAGAYLELAPNVELAYYRAELQKALAGHPTLNLPSDQEPIIGHTPSVAATFALSYDRLDTAQPTDNLALTLLHRAACCAAGVPIPHRLLLRAVELDYDAVGMPERAELALARLARLGLVALEPDGSVMLHRLLTAYIREYTNSNELEDVSAVAQALIDEIQPLNEARNPIPAAPYLDHLRVAVQKAQGRNDPQAATLLNEGGLLFAYWGEYAIAHPLLEHALAIREQILGPDHLDTAESLNDLGWLLHTIGEYAAARPLLERARIVFEQALGPTHSNTTRVLNNLAVLLYMEGDYTAARQLYELVLSIDAQKHPNHPATAQSLLNLGVLLFTTGNVAAARPLFERAVIINEQALPPYHPDIALSLNNLGKALYAQGEYDAARLHHERALAIRERALGSNHPDTAQSLNNLAEVLLAQKEYMAARPLLEHALAIRTQALGPDHQNTRMTQENLSKLLTAIEEGTSTTPL